MYPRLPACRFRFSAMRLYTVGRQRGILYTTVYCVSAMFKSSFNFHSGARPEYPHRDRRSDCLPRGIICGDSVSTTEEGGGGKEEGGMGGQRTEGVGGEGGGGGRATKRGQRQIGVAAARRGHQLSRWSRQMRRVELCSDVVVSGLRSSEQRQCRLTGQKVNTLSPRLKASV